MHIFRFIALLSLFSYSFALTLSLSNNNKKCMHRCSLCLSCTDRYCLVAWMHVILIAYEKSRKKTNNKKKNRLRISFGYNVTKRINLSMWTLSMKIGCNNKHDVCCVCERATVYMSSILLFNQFSVVPCVFPCCYRIVSLSVIFFYIFVYGVVVKWFVGSQCFAIVVVQCSTYAFHSKN